MLMFLYGEDDFRSYEKLKEIKIDFEKKNAGFSTAVFFDCEEKFSLEKIKEGILSSGLFSVNKIIVLENFIVSANPEEKKELADFLEKKTMVFSESNVVVFYEKNVPAQNDRFFKFLLSRAQCLNFQKLAGVSLERWAQERLAKRGMKIEKKALNKLVAYAGDDLWQMNNELEKLESYVSEEDAEKNFEKEIKEEDVDLLTTAKIQVNIFETVEALSAGDKKRALKLLYDRLRAGDDPHYVFSMYVYQFRNLLKTGAYYFQGIRDIYAIARQTRQHPFVVKKAMTQLGAFSWQKLKFIYRKLEKIDRQVKTGKKDILLALDQFVVEF